MRARGANPYLASRAVPAAFSKARLTARFFLAKARFTIIGALNIRVAANEPLEESKSMKSQNILAAAAILLATASGTAYAQYTRGGRSQSTTPQAPQQKQQQPGTLGAGSLKVSREAFKALSELKAAVDANDVANIPAKVAAAQAVARKPQDRYILGQLQLQAASKAKDDAAAATAIQAMLDTGVAPADQIAALTMTLAKTRYSLKQYDAAATALERLVAANANNSDALALLAETRNAQGRPAEAVAALQKALKAQANAGQKAPGDWYKRAVAIAYTAKLPVALQLSREWVAAYPTPANWNDALKVYRGLQPKDPVLQLDALRLGRAVNALGGESDYHVYLYNAVEAGAIGEAKAVYDEGIASGKIDANKAAFREAAGVIKQKIGTNDPALLESSAKAAIAGSAARPALRTADALYGIGHYAKAAELYRAALGKSGADANLLNLRLGMALARAGDKAGATAALNAVGGGQAELAKYWLLYVATH